MEIRVGGKYKICKRLGRGAFGELYQGINLKTNEEIAVKLEKLNCPQPMLQYEAKIYEKLQGNTGIATVHWSGVEGDYNVLVMEILGPSLQNLFDFCQGHFSMGTIVWLGLQMIQRVEAMHQNNFIHRDIKPENFLIGAGKKTSTVYCIDFGLSKRYKCPKSGQHISFKQRNGITGTPRYCSLNAHRSFEQSRRDDLESIGNILIYMARKGSLPWMHAEDGSERDQLRVKLETTLESLCEGLPRFILKFMQYVRSMKFEQKPDYKYVKGLFEEYISETKFEMDFSKADWVVQKEKILEEKRRKEEEEKQKALMKKAGKSKLNKRLEQKDAEAQAQFEQIQEEKRKKQEEKKRKKAEKQEEEKVVKNSPEYVKQQKIMREKKIQEKIEKAVKAVENSAIPKYKRNQMAKEKAARSRSQSPSPEERKEANRRLVGAGLDSEDENLNLLSKHDDRSSKDPGKKSSLQLLPLGMDHTASEDSGSPVKRSSHLESVKQSSQQLQ